MVTTPISPAASTTYTYLPSPKVTAISPAVGPTAGGQTVTITGTNFDTSATTFVNIGGVAATGVSFSGSNIIATTPAYSPAGPQSVEVIQPGSGGSGKLVNGYTYQDTATVTLVNPASGSTAGGQAVTIYGTNFLGASLVTFGGTAAVPFTVVDSKTITATTPAHSAGPVTVEVTTASGLSTGGANKYTYSAAPTVTLVSPNNGPLVGGQSVTITGTNFVINSTSVTIGGQPATNVVVNPGLTTLTATTPAHVAGQVDVVVTTPSGSGGTGNGLYTYGTVPIVTAISPAVGPTTGGQAVTISGQNFTGATLVTIGGLTAAIGTVSATTITATTPAHAAGLVDVVVTTPSGSGTGPNLYNYYNPVAALVTVSAISPAVGPLVGGQSVTVTGTNFTVNTTSLTIGGVAATNVVVTSSTTLTAKTPAHAAGAVDVVVATPSGSGGTGNGLYTYATVPIVTAISPPTGPIGGGQAVTITGQNFTGATSVTIGGSAATIGTVSATTITATTPAHAAGQADVVVTTPIGTGTGTNIYTYVVPLTLVAMPATPAVPTVGQTYSQKNTASGGTPGYTYSVSGGSLPAGTSLNTATGLVFGSPTALGNFSYTITATDSSVPAQTAAQTVTGTIAGIVSAPVLTSSPNPSFLGQSVTLTATQTPNTCTGTIKFTDLTSATVLCNAVPIVNGFANCTVKFTTPGAHHIQATYPGSAQCLPSVSPVLVQTVNDQRIKTVETIGNFMSRRNDLIMSGEPDLNRQVDRLTEADDRPVGGPPVAPALAASGSASRLGVGPDAIDLTRMRFGLRDRPGAALPEGSPFSSPSSAFGPPGSDQATGGGGVTAGPMQLTGNTDGAARFGFATSLRDMARYAAAAEASKTTEAGVGFAAGQGSIAAARFSPFDIWVEGKYTNFRDSSVINSAVDGQFGLISVGADYVLNRWLLVGVMGQFDIMTQRSQTQGTEVSGRGWMAGPYATLRVTDHLFWQARGAWGQSSNEVNPFGTYTDKFETERWLASSTLLGRWGMGAWQFRPSVSVAYMEDVSKSYTDTFGIVIPEIKSRLGQAKAGPEIGYRYQFSPDLMIEPHVGIQAIYNFAGSTTNSLGVVAGQDAGPEGVRGRIEIGQRATTSSGISIQMSGSYDGIGSKGYEAYSAKAQVHLPLR